MAKQSRSSTVQKLNDIRNEFYASLEDKASWEHTYKDPANASLSCVEKWYRLRNRYGGGSSEWFFIPSSGSMHPSGIFWNYPFATGVTSPTNFCIGKGYAYAVGRCRFTTTFTAEGALAANSLTGTSWGWSCNYGSGSWYANPANTEILCAN